MILQIYFIWYKTIYGILNYGKCEYFSKTNFKIFEFQPYTINAPFCINIGNNYHDLPSSV